MARLCAEAKLDPRDTAIMSYIYIDHDTEWEDSRIVPDAREAFWEELAQIVGLLFPPPVSWQTIRNRHGAAKKRLRDELETRRRTGREEDHE